MRLAGFTSAEGGGWWVVGGGWWVVDGGWWVVGGGQGAELG